MSNPTTDPDYVPPGTPSDESDGPIDLARFVEDGVGFTVTKEGEGDLPIFDWAQNDPEIITQPQELDK